MAEQVYERLQLGRETTEGTAVAATKVYPTNPGILFDLDRGYSSPDEDYAGIGRHIAGRGSYGLRQGGFTLGGVLTYEGVMDLWDMTLGLGAVSGATDKTWVHSADWLTKTTKSYTAEAGNETQAWQLRGVIISDLTLSFDALTAPGESPWSYSGTAIARDKQPAAFTGALSAPTQWETVEGHLTRLYEGTTATAFTALSELTASLISFSITITNNFVLRGYGSALDVATESGRSDHREITFEAQVKQSATTKTNIYDIYNAAGAIAGERRWKIETLGSLATSLNRTLRLEFRPRFTGIPTGERAGEQTFAIAGHAVYDATLGTDLKGTAINLVPSL